ncbi:carbohydrate ABC transporter permease [Paenibacillus eucommiae]|uniref:Aldouronate transport system permease protein n=1 Tax=Paenibacillus eucommiae TaxID=1355755 RepID=A0ABS4J7G3_9BACL|nr:carbohydrate ABC transporter permease [Paenibacillus eucommiae]MBP1995763.1 putative aldouronate transport system permease protein [Paenibacillus eucommiae]
MVKVRWNLFDVINYALMGLLCILIIYPFLYMTAVSLSGKIYVMQGKVFLYPLGITFKSYQYMLSNNVIVLAFLNTIKYTLVGTISGVLLTVLSAYPLSKQDFFGRKLFMKVIVVTMIFNGGIIPNYLLILKLGLYNSLWALVLPVAINGVFIIMTITFFQAIPKELEESAMIDGCSVYGILFKIILPVSKPLMAALALFFAMYHYNSYFLPLIYLSDKTLFPLQVVLKEMIISAGALMEEQRMIAATEYAQVSLQYATIIISILPMLVVFPFIQKYFIKGVMVGAIKG